MCQVVGSGSVMKNLRRLNKKKQSPLKLKKLFSEKVKRKKSFLSPGPPSTGKFTFHLNPNPFQSNSIDKTKFGHNHRRSLSVLSKRLPVDIERTGQGYRYTIKKIRSGASLNSSQIAKFHISKGDAFSYS